MCPQERLAIISRTTGLSFVLKSIGPLAAIIIALFYLLPLYLFVIIKTYKNPFVSVCSETLLESTSQHLLLLVGFDTLIYRKYCDRPPILVGHQDYFLTPLPGSKVLLVSRIGKEHFYYKCCFYFYLLFYFIMEPSEFEATLGDTLSDALVAARGPPPIENVRFEITM